MFVVGIALVMAVSACKRILHRAGRESTMPFVVTSPNSNVFLGGSEQMTATASDGRALAGTWGSDNPLGPVTVNAATGLAAAVSAGQANVFYIADGRQGAKLIRALPNFAGNVQRKLLVITAVRRPARWRRQTSATRPRRAPWCLTRSHSRRRARSSRDVCSFWGRKLCRPSPQRLESAAMSA